MKTCSVCHLSKNLTEFDLDRSKKDGHRSICKTCRRPARLKDKVETFAQKQARLRGELNRDALLLLIQRHEDEFADIKKILADQRGLAVG